VVPTEIFKNSRLSIFTPNSLSSCPKRGRILIANIEEFVLRF